MATFSEKVRTVEAIQFDLDAKTFDCIAYSDLHKDGARLCSKCKQPLVLHGIVAMSDGNGTVCPGSWRVTRDDGTVEYMGDVVFKARYEAVKDDV